MGKYLWVNILNIYNFLIKNHIIKFDTILESICVYFLLKNELQPRKINLTHDVIIEIVILSLIMSLQKVIKSYLILEI